MEFFTQNKIRFFYGMLLPLATLSARLLLSFGSRNLSPKMIQKFYSNHSFLGPFQPSGPTPEHHSQPETTEASKPDRSGQTMYRTINSPTILAIKNFFCIFRPASLLARMESG